MVQRSCTKTNNDVRKQGGGDDEQSPYLKIPHTSKEKRKRNASGKVLRFWLVTLSRGLSPKSLRLLLFLLQQLQTSLLGSPRNPVEALPSLWYPLPTQNISNGQPPESSCSCQKAPPLSLQRQPPAPLHSACSWQPPNGKHAPFF